jgi:hypothetical protein
MELSHDGSVPAGERRRFHSLSEHRLRHRHRTAPSLCDLGPGTTRHHASRHPMEQHEQSSWKADGFAPLPAWRPTTPDRAGRHGRNSSVTCVRHAGIKTQRASPGLLALRRGTESRVLLLPRPRRLPTRQPVPARPEAGGCRRRGAVNQGVPIATADTHMTGALETNAGCPSGSRRSTVRPDRVVKPKRSSLPVARTPHWWRRATTGGLILRRNARTTRSSCRGPVGQAVAPQTRSRQLRPACRGTRTAITHHSIVGDTPSDHVRQPE